MMFKQKKIKNYIILVLIFVLGIGLTLYMCNCYEVYDEYQKQTPVIRGTLYEITNEELDHYIMENPTTIIYMCTSNNDTCRNYEKGLKKLSKDLNLSDYVIYLNLTGLDQDEFVSEFNDTYGYKVDLTSNFPALVSFEDGEVNYILQSNQKQPLTISKTKQFLELNSIGE